MTYKEIPVAADSSGRNRGPKVTKEIIVIPCSIYTSGKGAKPKIQLRVVRYEDTRLGDWDGVLQKIEYGCAGRTEEAKGTPSTADSSGMPPGSCETSLNSLEPSTAGVETVGGDLQSLEGSLASSRQTT